MRTFLGDSVYCGPHTSVCICNHAMYKIHLVFFLDTPLEVPVGDFSHLCTEPDQLIPLFQSLS